MEKEILPQSYDEFWPHVGAENLKKMAALWDGSSKFRKDESIAYLRAAFADPRQVKTTIARMQPLERAALGILKFIGNSAELSALGLAVRATGTVPDQSRSVRHYGSDSVGQSLLERGVIMMTSGSRYVSYDYGTGGSRAFTDSRLLAPVEGLEHRPFLMAAADPPTAVHSRRAQSVVLDIISMLRAVSDLGGIGMTKNGDPRANDLRKFAKKMGWGDQTEFDGLAFPDPARFYVAILLASGLLTQTDGGIAGSAPLEAFGTQPTADILQGMVSGIFGLREWVEYQTEFDSYWIKHYGSQGRLAVLTALRCLPDDLRWFRFADFEQGLFERIGESFSVGGASHRPHLYGQTAAAEREALVAWRQELRAKWLKKDEPWLQAIFRTWLYAFGLVELGLVDGVVDRFRLTAAGRAVLRGESADAEMQISAEPQPAWVVQPNFDVVVYLADASTEQVTFLEQNAERVRVSQHTAHYQITRDSIYEGLQRGVGAERIIEILAAGSRVELPANVVSEIRGWASLRERIVVRQRADLLEFPDSAARRQAIEQGTAGLEVGDRFLLLRDSANSSRVTKAVMESVDYAVKPAQRCLRVSEDGLISFSVERNDLLTLGYLNLWAEREGEGWRLTRERVSAVVKRGRALTELLAFLQDRLTEDMPGFLTVALRSWAGEAAGVGLIGAVVLQCSQPAILDALLANQSLKSCLLGRIGPDALLVNSADVDKVKAALDWANIRVSGKITGYRG